MDILAWRSTKTLFCRVPFSFLLGVRFVWFLLCTEKRLIKCGEPTQTQMRGRRRALRHNFFFRRGCATMRRRLAEISSLNMWSSITEQEQEACRVCVPILGQPTRTAIHFGAPGARQGQVFFDARLGRSWRRHLAAQGRNARMQQRYRCRPGRRRKKTGTMGQFGRNSSAHMYSYTIMYFKPVSPVSSAPCTRCGRLGASRKKKCWFMVSCRERPAWWGALVKTRLWTSLDRFASGGFSYIHK